MQWSLRTDALFRASGVDTFPSEINKINPNAFSPFKREEATTIETPLGWIYVYARVAAGMVGNAL